MKSIAFLADLWYCYLTFSITGSVDVENVKSEKYLDKSTDTSASVSVLSCHLSIFLKTN